eukprot:jgi/Botrbrau1/22689/Bobra.0132s0030.1
MRVETPSVVSFLGGLAVGAVLAVALYETTRTRRRNGHAEPSGLSLLGSESLRNGKDKSSNEDLDIYKDEVLVEMFTRNIQFFGAEKQAAVSRSFVVIVGLGGVGSHAAHLLLRSGVGKLRLIDFDQVTLSSLNRHALATRADVGMPKATCLKRHFETIFPEAYVDARVSMYSVETENDLLSGDPDYVLDAIDNIETKVALLALCKKRSIPVLCVAGAGAKADPTRLRIADISESVVDPLARAVRQRLKREHGITSGVPVVLSTEKPCCHLVPIEEVGQNPLDFQIVPNFRIRTIPVLGMLPAIFGMAAAAYITCQLAGRPFEPEPVFKITGPQYEAQLARLSQREEVSFGNPEGPAVGLDDVIYLVRELWRGVSARAPRHVMPGGSKGLNRSTANLTLTRWDSTQEATADNLVLLTFEEADKHDLCTIESLRETEPAWVAYVEAQLQRARAELGVG